MVPLLMHKLENGETRIANAELSKVSTQENNPIASRKGFRLQTKPSHLSMHTQCRDTPKYQNPRKIEPTVDEKRNCIHGNNKTDPLYSHANHSSHSSH